MDELTITSIVATGRINREFELRAIANELNTYFCQYNPEQLPGLHLRFYEDGPTVIIFQSGSFNIRGASTIREIYENKSLLENNISELGIKADVSDFDITNIVFTADLEKQLDLNELIIEFGLENIEYEPEQFPGLVYRLEQGVILIFSSGKLVLTGFTEAEHAQQAYNKLSSDLIDD